MFAFPHMLNLLVHEFTGSGRRRLAFFEIPLCLRNRFLIRHLMNPPQTAYLNWMLLNLH